MKANELAWAAGFFEGEGSVFRSSGRLHVSLDQVEDEPHLVGRMLDAVGIGRIYGPYKLASGKHRYRWCANDDDAATIAMERLLPYLGKHSAKVRKWKELCDKSPNDSA